MTAFDFPASPTVGQSYNPGTGIFYVWDGAAWRSSSSTAPLANSQRTILYNTAGTFAYVKPAGLKYLQVEIWGAGGGGGGAAATTTGQQSAGGGGGGGGYVRKLYNATDLAASENLVLGVGGAGGVGATAVNGAAGTNSTFKSVVASAGGGGATGVVKTVFGFTSRGTAGGSSGGDVNGQGNSGQYGYTFWNNAGAQPGYGGAGYGMAQFFYAYLTGTSAGASGAKGVGGNAGANGAASQPAVDGGKGGDAYAVFTEYYNEADNVVNVPPFDSLTIGDPTSTTASLTVLGTHDEAFVKVVSTGNTDGTITSPEISMYRDKPTWLDDDYLGAIRWYKGTPQSSKLLSAIMVDIWDITAGAEDVNLAFGVINNGAYNTPLYVYGQVVQLSYGKLQFPSAQVASTNVNILDDYEEGTWTPTLSINTSTAGITYSAQAGTYTKIGRYVFATFDFTLSAKGASVGAVTLNLPFTAVGIGSASFGYWTAMASVTNLLGYVTSTAMNLRLSGAAAIVNVADTNLTATTRIIGTMVFQTAT